MLSSLRKTLRYIKSHPEVFYEVEDFIKRYGLLATLKKIKQYNSSHSLLENQPIKILFIDGNAAPAPSDCINQVCISLEKAGIKSTQLEDSAVCSAFQDYDLFVLFRCSLTPLVVSIIKYANSQEKLIVYDSDNSLFTRSRYTLDIKNCGNFLQQDYSSSTQDQDIIDTFVDIIDRDPMLSRRLKKRKHETFFPAILHGNISKREVGFPQQLLAIKESLLPEIDISVATYFSVQWLEKYLKSVAELSYPLKKINLYLTDHSESDEELLCLKNLVSCYKYLFKKIDMSSNKNNGFGHGHNSNIKRGRSEYILITNSNLEIDNKALLTLASQALRDDTNVASWEARQLPYENLKFYDPVTLDTAWSSAVCLMVRRSAFEHVGGFDERFFMYCSDVELSFRFRDYGYKVKYTPKAVVYNHAFEDRKFSSRQELGSFLGHVFIRYRYGKSHDIKATRKLYKTVKQQLRDKINFNSFPLNEHIKRYKKYANEFMNTPKKSAIEFPFFKTMYEVERDGAFYKANKILEETDLVSVIVRVHGDNVMFLNEAITSILNQTYTNIEIVVIEDKTNFCRSYCQSVKEYDYNIKYLMNQYGGRNSAANAGLKAASGEYMMFLDYDDLLFSDHVESLLYTLKNTKKCSAAIGQSWMIYTKYRGKDYFESGYQVFQASRKEKINHELIYKKNHFPIQAILFSRKLYDKYGGINEHLSGYEDWELWLRYSQYEQFTVIPKTTSMYRVRDFSLHNVDKDRRQKEARDMIMQMYKGRWF